MPELSYSEGFSLAITTIIMFVLYYRMRYLLLTRYLYLANCFDMSVTIIRLPDAIVESIASISIQMFYFVSPPRDADNRAVRPTEIKHFSFIIQSKKMAVINKKKNREIKKINKSSQSIFEGNFASWNFFQIKHCFFILTFFVWIITRKRFSQYKMSLRWMANTLKNRC